MSNTKTLTFELPDMKFKTLTGTHQLSPAYTAGRFLSILQNTDNPSYIQENADAET